MAVALLTSVLYHLDSLQVQNPEGMGVCRQNPELEVHLVNKTPLVSLGHMPALVCLGNRPPLEEEGTDP